MNLLLRILEWSWEACGPRNTHRRGKVLLGIFKEYYESMMDVEETCEIQGSGSNQWDMDVPYKTRAVKTPLERAEAEMSSFIFHNN